MTDRRFVTEEDEFRRLRWVEQIGRSGGNFEAGSETIERGILEEVRKEGVTPLLGHLRQCGAIPEQYGHDSSEEKLYAKYTDIVIHSAFTSMGLSSVVLKVRSGVADVECVGDDYSFVADAKAFRLSRTAKNQKDFKVQAMDGWKHGKPYALLVCPIYQLPTRNSAIYQQAAARSVCILSYTHLTVLVRYARENGGDNALALLHEVFKAVEAMNPGRSASGYWREVNGTILESGERVVDLWREEKLATFEGLDATKEEALTHLAKERERIMRLSQTEAIREVLELRKLTGKEETVKAIRGGGLLELA